MGLAMTQTNRKRISRALWFLGIGVCGWLLVGWVAHRRAEIKRIDRELIEAVASGNSARVKYLLSCGGDPNASERHWEDPPSSPWDYLHELVRPRTGIGSRQGDTALMLAAARGDLQSTRMLVEAGAAANLQDDHGSSALMFACGLKGPLESSPEESARTAGRLPIREIITLLLDAGADPKIKTDEGFTALRFLSMYTERTDCAEVLLQRGAILDDPADDGTTPFWCSLNTGQSKMARYLLDRGARVDVCSSDPNCALVRTCLAQAFRTKDAELIRRLLDHGAKFDPKDAHGPEAAIVYAVHFDGGILRSLLDRYANPRVNVRVMGLTALQTARQEGYRPAVALLRKHGYTE